MRSTRERVALDGKHPNCEAVGFWLRPLSGIGPGSLCDQTTQKRQVLCCRLCLEARGSPPPGGNVSHPDKAKPSSASLNNGVGSTFNLGKLDIPHAMNPVKKNWSPRRILMVDALDR
ncbi:uncharacterized protein PHALS_09147 [Plasmopara halstedii]|uniref:Uncharacterized protein n=1 Tax=Plasmopara halstedii TaxID=4781 RepID=A0A0P1ADL8_PLAHL|nr:uncharacterized protein PHALS_09147 [Plasmopara halstedii]CEG39085.1 hypothetical protein PHALS_09147 [Plasmopara halstedii]|eukprot:XP_024575454.1 hypothetical protein PHALS_09147 [Plasmopara halstedii]